MGKIEDDFLKKLLSTFKIEAQEHINAMSSGLMKLEKASTAEEQMDLIEIVFREAHSLKGAARAVNMAEMEALCQAQEGVFAALKRKEITLSPLLLDVLHQSVDRLGKLLLFTQDKETGSEKSRVTELISNLESALTGVLETPIQDALRTIGGEGSRTPKPEAGPPLAEERPGLAATVRIPTAKLDLLLRQAEELRSAKLATAQRATELRALSATLAQWKAEWAKVQPEARRARQLLESKGKRNGKDPTKAPLARLLIFLDWHQTQAKLLESELTALAKATEHDQRSLGSMVDNLLEDMKTVLMLPFSALLESFPKLVRELARDQGKDVELAIRGGDIEIDRRILEEVKDPLIHLVRNGIHHGIEKPETRESKNKPRRGTITIAIAQKEGGKVEILISDDGAGIDTAKVQAAALKLGLATPAEAGEMSEPEALSLIFRSGVSTSPIITDIAGRGLGLAIVWEKVEKLGGSVSCETRAHAGTTFRMILPVTLATFRGVIVRVEERAFVLPTTNVARALRVRKEDSRTVENRETVRINGQVLPLVRLADVLELSRKRASEGDAEHVHVVVLASAEGRIAFLVDEVLDEQDVLVKGLGAQLSRVRNISGATILGTGQVVPILHVPDLVKSAVRANGGLRPSGVAAPPEEKEAKRKSVLVVEDSITARTLLKNILEMAGYEVKTAVDGIDALTQLRTGEFAIVISDVDMPRLNGFGLTAQIRSDKRLAELPVVLVTGLESREDRERGIEAGADAYIVKSSFDQSNLLEAIGRLI